MKCPIDSAQLQMSERQGIEIDFTMTTAATGSGVHQRRRKGAVFSASYSSLATDLMLLRTGETCP